MKKKTKSLIGLLLTLGISATLAGCTSTSFDRFVDEMDGKGHTITVKYDANGGLFANRENAQILHAYSLENRQVNSNGEYEIKLVEPGSVVFGEKENLSVATKQGYFVAGWYKSFELRKDQDGNALDDYGNVIKDENGDPIKSGDTETLEKVQASQAYVYSDPWNFETDKLTISASGNYSSEQEQLTLYAAWAPCFEYNFYVQNDQNEWEKYSEYVDMAMTMDKPFQIELPKWDTNSGALELGGFPAKDGYTFEKAFSDKEMTNEFVDVVTHHGKVDIQTGISTDHVQDVYVTWKKGTWFKIEKAEQFLSNARPDGSYEILKDLDFSGKVWPTALSINNFTGEIVGNGHIFKNITAKQVGTNAARGGLFGGIADSAIIRNLTFENVSYTVLGSRVESANFGLFAGTLSSLATIENVAVSGKLIVKPGELYSAYNASVGVFSGNGETGGISTDNVTYEIAPKDEYDINEYEVTVDEDTLEVTVTIKNN